jgi:hypothetical protein
MEKCALTRCGSNPHHQIQNQLPALGRMAIRQTVDLNHASSNLAAQIEKGKCLAFSFFVGL